MSATDLHPGAPTTPPRFDTEARLGTDATLVDVLDRVLDRGVVISGDVLLSVAGVDLIYIGLRVVIKGVE